MPDLLPLVALQKCDEKDLAVFGQPQDASDVKTPMMTNAVAYLSHLKEVGVAIKTEKDVEEVIKRKLQFLEPLFDSSVVVESQVKLGDDGERVCDIGIKIQQPDGETIPLTGEVKRWNLPDAFSDQSDKGVKGSLNQALMYMVLSGVPRGLLMNLDATILLHLRPGAPDKQPFELVYYFFKHEKGGRSLQQLVYYMCKEVLTGRFNKTFKERKFLSDQNVLKLGERKLELPAG
nr:hypothetical protein HK105_005201 [Polyrhizophydium stewartii]